MRPAATVRPQNCPGHLGKNGHKVPPQKEGEGAGKIIKYRVSAARTIESKSVLRSDKQVMTVGQ